MYRIVFLLSFLSFSFFSNIVFSQVSYASGFYEDRDSLFFEVNWEVFPNEEIQIAVNRNSEDGFKLYKSGIWLKDRNYTENTWEDVHLSTNTVQIQFNGTGYDGLRIIGQSTSNTNQDIRIIVKENSDKGDIFSAYSINKGILSSIDSSLQPQRTNKKPPYIIDSEDGWKILWEKGNGYTIGDYWDIKIRSSDKCNYPASYTQPRGLLRKVNTVKVRSVDLNTNEVLRDSTYIIGFGQIPYKHPILFVSVDSADVIDVLKSGEDEKAIKNINLQIMYPSGETESLGSLHMKKAAGSSYCLPNHGVSFKAKKKLGKEVFETKVFGQPKNLKELKFRVGGSNQSKGFSTHEIALAVTKQSHLEQSSKNFTVATMFLNGSYWSLGFLQEKTNKQAYEIKKNKLGILKPFNFGFTLDTMFSGIENGIKGTFIKLNYEFHQLLNRDQDSLMFITKDYFDINKFLTLNNINKSKYQVLGRFKGNNKKDFEDVLLQVADSNSKIDSLIDIDRWCEYISTIHFFNLSDIIGNNNSLVKINGNKIFPIILDFDGAGELLTGSNWNLIFEKTNNYEGIVRYILTSLEKSQTFMNRLALVYQDLLNTNFRFENTIPIVDSISVQVLPYYHEYNISWNGYPNGGQSAQEQVDLYNQLKEFYLGRPNISYQLLSDFLMPKERYSLNNLNEIKIIFDNIPKDIVTLKLNSLEVRENFSGLYFPKPNLQISYNVKEGYDIFIKEYPSISNNFELACDSNITLTFELKKIEL